MIISIQSGGKQPLERQDEVRKIKKALLSMSTFALG